MIWQRVKDLVKLNKKLYLILKPFVDQMRILLQTFLGYLRRFRIFQNKNYRALKEYAGKFQGEKCIIVANGPSLTVEDLTRLDQAGIKCFGCNHINKMFSETEWRPDFWCVTDGNVIGEVIEQVPEEIPFFTLQSLIDCLKYKENVIFVKDLYLDRHIVRTNMMSWWAMSVTVSVFMIELAIYMGFKEIILLGLDCTYNVMNYQHFETEGNEKYADYSKILKSDIDRLEKRGMTPEEFNEYIYNMFVEDFSNIYRYAQKENIKIYNSTRGGKLEVYPRVSLESLLDGDRKHS